MSDITVTIPVELTQAMIMRGGVVEDEARAHELAIELHEVVAELVKLYRAEKTRVVEIPEGEDDPAKFVELEPSRTPNALEIADFTLAVWQQALPSDDEQDEWISVKLAALCDKDEDLFLRWTTIGDVVTGSDLASILMGSVN
jgi:hypothetical protein